jgi:uncharacterized membrane protein
MKINEKRGITQLTGFFVAFKIHVFESSFETIMDLHTGFIMKNFQTAVSDYIIFNAF